MSHTIEQIKAALNRRDKMLNGYGEQVVAIHGELYAYIGKGDNKLWTNSLMETEITQDGLSKWRIEEKCDSFQENGFIIKCHTKTYAEACIIELEEIDVWKGQGGINLENVYVVFDPSEAGGDVCYDFFTDRDTWLAHAQAIKERESRAFFVQNDNKSFRVVEAYEGHHLLDRLMGDPFYFQSEQEAQSLADRLNAVLDGAKVVKDAIALKTSAVCNHKAKDIHNIDWEATFNNL